jgi:L-serine dehydratase
MASMRTSLFDLYKIGIGPSSSHTMGPLNAAARFVKRLQQGGQLASITHLQVELFGSLALTGRGHGTDRGVLLGLMGAQPDTIDPNTIPVLIEDVRTTRQIDLAGLYRIAFNPETDILWRHDQRLPHHSNGLRFTAYAGDQSSGVVAEPLDVRTYYSVGGGFVVEEGVNDMNQERAAVTYPFVSAEDLLRLGRTHALRIDQIMLANELAWRSERDVRAGIQRLWKTMQRSIERGLATDGTLPGGLNVVRRAPALARRLAAQNRASDPLRAMDWLNAYAIAVNEENAAGGRVVTAPTNGAAGIVPAVAYYYTRELSDDTVWVERYFLTSAAIGVLYKENASISGAEVGCQGEVGVACSMAAAGLAAALGGTNEQVEHAAEIGMEHHLGMTCDPIAGLVQIPCIERNAFGAVKAVNAARMALGETAGHKVSLDQVIRTMYQTGLDMQTRYKETSQAGLAVNVPEC